MSTYIGQVAAVSAKAVTVRVPEILDDIEVDAIAVGATRIVDADGNPTGDRGHGLRKGDRVLLAETATNEFVVICPLLKTGAEA